MNKPPGIPIAKPVVPQHADIGDNIAEILSRGALTKGRYLEEFEAAAAARLRVKHAVGVSSCTTGLMLAYRALELRGEVIVPSFTFMATVSSLVWAGVTPVFAESDFITRNVDPRSVEEKITARTTAIVAVHNFGNPANIDALRNIARRYALRLIFDAAHAFGATYKSVAVGGQGDAQVFSLTPTKLVVAGEGGIVTTNDDNLAKRLRQGREYGNGGGYNSVFAGLNGRLPELSALIGLKSLDLLDAAVENRNSYAEFYKARLGKLDGIGFQQVSDGDRCCYKDFCIAVDEERFGMSREALAITLAAENIDTRSYYDPPVHKQTAYEQFAHQEVPITDQLARECLSLPMWSEMDGETLDRICGAVEFAQRDRKRASHREYLSTARSGAIDRNGNNKNANRSMPDAQLTPGEREVSLANLECGD